MGNYRLYIDESGHHRYKLAGSLSERYLGLCGVAIHQDTYLKEVIPRIESIRSLFYTDPDLKPYIHCEDMIRRKNDFSKLRDATVAASFNKQLLALYSEVDYKIFAVTIDKTKHFNQYVTPEHPYHYSLECLLERYYKFLAQNDGQGDVMAEARGTVEDTKIKEVYRKFYDHGTSYVNAEDMRKRFTSHDIKIKTKRYLTQGLEFADLLALATKLDVLFTYEQLPELTTNFTRDIIETIQPKYFGFPRVKGNGKKFI